MCREFSALDPDFTLVSLTPVNRFAGVVKLHAILIRASTAGTCPRTLKIFRNRDDVDFSSAVDLSPVQTLEVSQTSEVQELAVKRPLFNNTYSLTLFFEDNHGGEDVSEVFWIGFKGEFAQLNREPVEVLYEKAANPKDHAMIAGIGEKGALSGGRLGM